jgi:hypothetical protein
MVASRGGRRAVRGENNRAAVITRDGARDFANAGIADPADHYFKKTIRVSGKVTLHEGWPRIEVNEAKQIELVTTP